MATTVNITTIEVPVSVDLTTPAAEPVTVDVTVSETPVSVSVSLAAAPAITMNVALTSTPVSVDFTEARDAYQLAVAEGFAGTRAEWLASLQGEQGTPGNDGADGADGAAGADGADGADGAPGANAEHVILTLAEYLALPPETQLDGRWYVIPKP